MSLHGALREFANTLKEWHYLIGGFASGLTVGLLLAVYLAIQLAKANRDNNE